MKVIKNGKVINTLQVTDSYLRGLTEDGIARHCGKTLWKVSLSEYTDNGYALEQIVIDKITPVEYFLSRVSIFRCEYHHPSEPEQVKNELIKDMNLFLTLEEAKSYIQSKVNETVVTEDPVNETAIYKVSLVKGLVQIPNDNFVWNDIDGRLRQTTLNDIYREAVRKGLVDDALVVFYIGPLKGKIYECGKYSEGNWSISGTLKGYA